MVAGGEADIFRSGIAEGGNPLLGVEAVRIERLRRLGIFSAVDVGVGHEPLALCEEAVDSPVDEDAEASLGKKFSGFKVFGRGDVGLLCDGADGEPREKEEEHEEATEVERSVFHGGGNWLEHPFRKR